MKKLLLIFMAVLLLVGCSRGDASSITAGFTNSKEVKRLVSNKAIKLQSGSLDKESSLEYYQGWIDNINESDLSDVDDELVDFIHAFGIFSKYMVEHIEVDNDLMSAGYAGDATGRSVHGIMVYVFSEDVTISSDDLAIINNPNLNEIHFIYTYKNVLVTVDANFVSDYDVFFEEVKHIIEKKID